MAEVTADLGLAARHALKTLSRPMRDALRSAPRRDGILTLDCEVGTGTSVALIRRNLVEAGSTHPLTALGLEVRGLLRAERALTISAPKLRATLDEPAVQRGAQPLACVRCGNEIVEARGENCQAHTPGPLFGVTRDMRIRLSILPDPTALYFSGNWDLLRQMQNAGLITRVASNGYRLTKKGKKAWEAVGHGELSDALKFAMLRPTATLDERTVRELCERGLLVRDMGGEGLPVQTAKGRQVVREILDELGLAEKA